MLDVEYVMHWDSCSAIVLGPEHWMERGPVPLLVRVHMEAGAGWVTEAAVASVEVAAVSVVAARRTSIRCPAALSTSCGRVYTYPDEGALASLPL